MKIEPTSDFAPTFNEPQLDWVPIERALFYFSGDNFQHLGGGVCRLLVRLT